MFWVWNLCGSSTMRNRSMRLEGLEEVDWGNTAEP